MKKKKLISGFLSTLMVASLLPFGGGTVKAEEPNVDLWNAIKPLNTTVTFLNTGAHPDDERSDFLAYLSRGLGIKTSSLIANRGEGGQNEIGDELGNALGIIRSRELIEAAKITGVKAYHLSQKTSDPIYDFGFSKSVEETLNNWGEELTYERFIRFIRTYQPDILMPSFRNDPTQHGNHRAVEVLTERSFEDAANPNVFPEQLKEGLSVWQVKKLYLPGKSTTEGTPTTSIEIGMYDPIYGMTYPQLGEKSRYMHKSQGMGSDIPAGPRQMELELFKSAVGQKTDFFTGVPYDFKEWAGQLPKTENDLKVHFTKLQTELESIISSYPSSYDVFTKSQDALKEVRNLENKTGQAKLATSLKNDLLHKLSVKEEQLQNASFVASQLDVQASSEFNILTKGQTTTVTVDLKNNGKEKLHNVSADLTVPDSWKVSTESTPLNLSPGETTKVTFQVVVPDTGSYYDPYKAPVIQANVHYEFDGSKTSVVQDLKGTIAVLPDVGLTLSPEDIVVNTANVQQEVPVSVKVKNFREGRAQSSVSLNVPAGWSVSPSRSLVDFTSHLQEKTVNFTLTPPQDVQAGNFKVTAQAAVNGKTFDSTIQEIKYDHIGTFYYQYPAQVNGVAFELLKDNSLKIGYIDSGFDKVADYLSNVGMNITKLTESDLASGDLSQYNTIVVGIRAYLSRADLIASNERLKQYVYNGGHLVVQYHKPSDGWNAQTSAPYPLAIGNVSIKYRVTYEDAPVTVLHPESPIFNYPNKITNSDWDGWVQERGLYYPMSWDPQYQTLVRMGDPGEAPFDSGILVANYGKGTYIYSSLVFYRQIQGQVPGGYRIFTNLISYGN